MSTKVQIANQALDLVGQPVNVMSLDDPTPQARQCLKHIDQAIREVLAVGFWSTAQGRAALARLAAAPAFGWAYQYQLPIDYIRMVRFNELDVTSIELLPFKIEGTVLLTNEDSARIIYVQDLSDPNANIGRAGPLLVELFALRLASKIAWPLQQSATLRQQILQEYQMKERKALAQDAREARRPLVNRLSDSEWLKRRVFSTNG